MFKGQRVFVTGVTGNIGWGVARHMLREGATVLALVRRDSDAKTITSDLAPLGEIIPIVGDLAAGEGARAVAADIALAGGVGHAVLSLGGWWQGGPLRNQSAGSFDAVRAGLLDAQVNAAITILPALTGTDDPTYTIITGAGALMPVPNAGFTVVAAAGVVGLSMMLRSEEAHGPVRVNEVMIRTRVERTHRPGVSLADDFGAFVARTLAEGQRGAVAEYRGS